MSVFNRIDRLADMVAKATTRRHIVVTSTRSSASTCRLVSECGGICMYRQDADGDIEIDEDFQRVTINDVYIPMLDVDTRWLILFGGAGSGKSKFSAQKCVYRCLTERDHSIWVIRKTAASIMKSTWLDILWAAEKFGVGDMLEVHKKEMDIYLPATNSHIGFLGIDDDEKVKSIHRVTSQWLEEPTAMTPRDVTQLNLRMREKMPTYSQIVMSFNPISERHWIKKNFFDRAELSVQKLHTTYKDNDTLPDDYRRELESLGERDPLYHQVYCTGEWGKSEGAIYGDWPVVDGLPGLPDETLYGIDFGWNVTAVVRVDMCGGVPYVSQVMYAEQATMDDIYEALCDSVNRGEMPRGSFWFYGDSASPEKIDELNKMANLRGHISRHDGEIVPVHVEGANKSPGSVMAGIDYIRRKDVHVIGPSDDLMQEHDLYAMRTLPGGGEAPVKSHDHLMDAFRYALYTHSILNEPDHGDDLDNVSNVLSEEARWKNRTNG